MNVIVQKIQTEIKRINLKIICGIIATISIAVLGFCVLPALWFWISWEVLAAALVAIGCAGEWYLFLKPAKDGDEGHKLHHRRSELQFVTAVAIGVLMEFLALAHAIPEAVRLESHVEQLRSNNFALQLQLNEVTNDIAKKDPRNQRLKSLDASASIRFIPADKGADWTTRLSSEHFLTLETKTPKNFLQLTSDETPVIVWMGNVAVVAIRFHWHETVRAVQEKVGEWFPYLSFENSTAGQVMDGASFSEMGFFNFGKGTEILDGSVKVSFNGVEKTFPIRAQTVDGATNDPNLYRFR